MRNGMHIVLYEKITKILGYFSVLCLLSFMSKVIQHYIHVMLQVKVYLADRSAMIYCVTVHCCNSLGMLGHDQC